MKIIADKAEAVLEAQQKQRAAEMEAGTYQKRLREVTLSSEAALTEAHNELSVFQKDRKALRAEIDELQRRSDAVAFENAQLLEETNIRDERLKQQRAALDTMEQEVLA